MKSESLVKSHHVCFRGKLVYCLEETLRDENLLGAWLEALEVAVRKLPQLCYLLGGVLETQSLNFLFSEFLGVMSRALSQL